MEEITYKGIKFRRYPDSDNLSDSVYFTPGKADRIKGVQRLHQEVWKDWNGPIPEGHHVHHVDGNPLNNNPDNLWCLPDSEHLSQHSKAWHQSNRQQSSEHLDDIRPLATEWHRSKEGRAWHRKHGKRTWETREPLIKQCAVCDAQFEDMSRRPTSRFCSNKCKSKWRRDSGVDDVPCLCKSCGSTFMVNKYKGGKTCSECRVNRSRSGNH